jgi:hypothetical protein
MNTAPLQSCDACGQRLPLFHFGLDRRIELIDAVIPGTGLDPAVEESLSHVIRVLDCLGIGGYCGEPCWRSVEAAVLSAHDVRHPSPEERGLIANCARCGQAFLATQPHVTLVISEFEWDAPSGFNTLNVHHSETLAKFCPDCELPGAGQAEQHAESRPAAVSDLA